MFENSEMLKNLTDVEKKQLEVFCQIRKLKPTEVLFNE
jgi:hypothetical protein